MHYINLRFTYLLTYLHTYLLTYLLNDLLTTTASIASIIIVSLNLCGN